MGQNLTHNTAESALYMNTQTNTNDMRNSVDISKRRIGSISSVQ